MIDTSRIADGLRQAAESGDVPGVVAAAATANGVVFEGGFGKRDLTTGVSMTADTVVWIASMTKAVTAACAMQLVERGRLSLDGDIAAILPQLGRVQVLGGFDADGKPRLRAPKRPITLRHLLTHTSGYAYNMWNGDVARYMEQTATPSILTCQNAALTLPLIADPGEKWEYGISIDWAGKAVEAVSGQTLDKYMRENLLQPLGMTDTAFKIGDAQRRRLATIYSRTPAGLVPAGLEIPQDPEFHMGGGGLYSTVGDYLKFARMILHGGILNGARVLRPETVTAMCRSPGSMAWAGLANSYFWIDPARKVAGVYATQVLPFFDEKAAGAYECFETAVYQAL